MEPIAYREIVSNVLDTAGGHSAWLQQDAAGHLSVRCTGCGLDEYAAGMAPGLGALVNHAEACEE